MVDNYSPPILHDFELPSPARFEGVSAWHKCRILHQNPLDFVYKKNPKFSLEDICPLINLRHLCVHLSDRIYRIPTTINSLWNLQTLIFYFTPKVTAPIEIWKMIQLRHVEFLVLDLLDPPTTDDYVLWNLQTLSTITNFRCTEEVVRRIPNIKRLQIRYVEFEGGSHHCLNNLSRLRKLESLDCRFYSVEKPSRSDLLQNLSFPHSIKKLILKGCQLDWEDMTTKIGSLPLLEVLILYFESFKGTMWETVEGQFCNLKYLQVSRCYDLQYWISDSTHFPRLERLVLYGLDELDEIPFGIGEIPTLRSIVVEYCSNSAVISAKEILKEQEELGNVDLQVRVVLLENAYKELAVAAYLLEARTGRQL